MKDCSFKCSNNDNDNNDNNDINNINNNSNSKKTKNKSKKITLKLKTKKNIKNNDTNTDNYNYKDFPIMRFNIDKDIDEYKNLIKQLMKTSFNIKIENLKLYLNNIINNINTDIVDNNNNDKFNKKNKKITFKNKKFSMTTNKTKLKSNNNNNNNINNEIKDTFFNETFYRAIQEIINDNTIIIDKFNRNSKIVISGNYLRLVPEQNLQPNIAIQKQEIKTPITTLSQIDIKQYIVDLTDKQKKFITDKDYDYNEILNKYIIEKAEQIFYGTYSTRDYKYNVIMNLQEIIEFIFYKLKYSYKNIIIKTILYKIINGNQLTFNEKKLETSLQEHIILIKYIYPNSTENIKYEKNIYGYIIQNLNNLELFNYNHQTKTFEKDSGNIKKVIEYKYNLLNSTPKNKLYGFLKYEKNNEVVFKITDIDEKGDKKSVKGITCKTMSTTNIKNNLYKLNTKLLKNIKHNSISSLCIDMEYLFKYNDKIKLNNKKWFYTPEEYYIYFEYN